ncbi:DUF924 family protein [Rhizobium tubonense]|jgi:uncharacterized protein (DUF924 family)|uniref:DUF924 domain-containing protein n=1 Tax=Rhizobium tubonense TaxID=484088 RepID=A0A2W4CPE6_9HYPH|nr:DUF924 family protein [Rhizobium tubonense]PZM12848.1 hypothetical protein CPY51_14935 [Rhizobium tubonense]
MDKSHAICTPEEVLDFWFEECGREDWFKVSAALDEEIRRRFRDTHLALAGGVLGVWRATPENQLATVIVLDQFPRNIYRGTALAFATDGLALQEAKIALNAGADQKVARERRCFLYLPFEHAENLIEQEKAVEFFQALGEEEYIDFAIRHRAVIAAYGRFPHRNAALGRVSTEAERDYLAQPDAGF